MNNCMNVLLVEDQYTDEMLLRHEIQKVLPDSKFLCVEKKEDFIEALAVFHPDIILSDYSLPSFDGLTALRLANELHAETPFIIVTGSMNEDIAVECMKAGAVDYVIKEHLKRLGPAILRSLEQKEIRVQRKLAIEALNESEERYRSIFEVAPVGIAVILDEVILCANSTCHILFGAESKNQLLGKSITEIIHPLFLKQARMRIKGLMAGEQGLYPTEEVFIRLDGSIINVEVTATLLSYNQNPALQVIITDITERKKAVEDLVYISYHDHLTGLYNRRFFEEELERLNSSSNMPLAVIMGDVNGLKLVNDSFGHEAGDILLKKAADIIKMNCRSHNGIAARIGGDEFAIILTRTDEDKVEKIVDRLKEDSDDIELNKITLSISFGYAVKYVERDKMQQVLATAENYMYKHKIYEKFSERNRTIDVIMNALFEKSKREMLHSQRVSTLSAAIASELGLQTQDINKIRMAGLVHDIGKIGIDEKILNKEGKLDSLEYSEIRKHPEAGWRILSTANEFSDLAQYILFHQERWDGTGYPEGLKGEESPLESRIIAVADVYDAITSERPYKKAKTKIEAMTELKLCAGTQLDPQIVEVFLNKVLIKRIGQYRDIASE